MTTTVNDLLRLATRFRLRQELANEEDYDAFETLCAVGALLRAFDGRCLARFLKDHSPTLVAKFEQVFSARSSQEDRAVAIAEILSEYGVRAPDALASSMALRNEDIKVRKKEGEIRGSCDLACRSIAVGMKCSSKTVWNNLYRAEKRGPGEYGHPRYFGVRESEDDVVAFLIREVMPARSVQDALSQRWVGSSPGQPGEGRQLLAKLIGLLSVGPGIPNAAPGPGRAPSRGSSRRPRRSKARRRARR